MSAWLPLVSIGVAWWVLRRVGAFAGLMDGFWQAWFELLLIGPRPSDGRRRPFLGFVRGFSLALGLTLLALLVSRVVLLARWASRVGEAVAPYVSPSAPP